MDPIELRGLHPSRELDPGSFRQPVEGPDRSGSFADTLSRAVGSVDEAMKVSEMKTQDFIAGKSENVHDVMISMQKAQLSFQMMVEVRNKMIETYHEISRMQI